MTTRLPIGDFSRMTYLSVKALRHYHEQGVLAPAEVDAATGYRFYSPSQVGPAQTVRRLRDLGMPLDDVREVLRAPDPEARAATLVAHLRRMERRLEETQQTVASLRTLLSESPAPLAVARRAIPATAALAVVEHVRGDDAVAWWMGAFTLLHRCVRGVRGGADGALFPRAFFEDGEAEVTAFVPITRSPAGSLPARVREVVVPAVRAAVAVHDGPFGDLDRTYGALGTWVLERSAGADGPIREYYLPTDDPDDLLEHTTEVCWPLVGLRLPGFPEHTA
jgi:DNA-binding transcriptional MerR regulator/effector-binding domain-containing protein